MGIMKRLLENSSPRTRRGASVGGGGVAGEVLEISGITENLERFSRIMMEDPDMERHFRTVIRKVLKEARGKLSKDAQAAMKSDPRKAARAVKYAVYKSVFGGNLSILQKRKKGAESTYTPTHASRAGMWGGNRRKRVDDARNRLDKYFGADRGFILRFLASGTVTRQTRYGSRGRIPSSNWFGRTAPWQMEQAAEDVANAINEYINQTANG